MMRVLRELRCSLGLGGVLVLCYHTVRSATGFAAQLDALTARGYAMVPLTRVLAWLAGAEPLPPRAVLLTFDHVYANQLEHAVPVLAERRVPATFFPVAADLAASRPLRRAVAALALAGHSIGAHTHSHRRLPRLSDAEVRRELTDSRRLVEEVAAAPAATFSYPFGAWDARVARLVREAGYEAAFTADLGIVRRDDDRFSLRRACVLGEPGPQALITFVTGTARVPGMVLAVWKLSERWLNARRPGG